MPKYLFTSDQRISVLPEKIKWVANYVLSHDDFSGILDKSENNNASTLRFYYNLFPETEICASAALDPKSAIRNYIKKFQYPNPRTEESLQDSLSEGTLFAPFRVVVNLLYNMHNLLDDDVYLTLDEILYFAFCNQEVYTYPKIDYKKWVDLILQTRNTNVDLAPLVMQTLQWNQYGRQVKEMMTALKYACGSFVVRDGKVKLLGQSISEDDEDFIKEVIAYNRFWYPSDASNYKLSQREYISYMDTANTPYSIIDFESKINKIVSEDHFDFQVIYYGAPGTGKSHYINSKIDKERTIRTTFHPDSDYSSFVGCYKPIEKNNNSDRVYNASELLDILNSFNGEKYQSHKFSTLYWNSLSKLTPKEIKEIISSAGLNETYYQEVIKGMAVGGYIDTLAPKTTGGITYSFVPQAFTNAYVNAWKDLDHVYYLVIEEINRGNCAQIFGDLFQLLDREDDGLSSYAIQPNTDLQNYLARQFAHSDISDAKIKSGEEMRIPTNLCILATMNTSDQSLFPIDSAFKRRWDWKYIPISKGDEEHYIAVNSKLYSWWSFMKIVNDKIEDVTSSEDKQIGYWFAKADSNKQIPTDKFVSKVIFYLWNDVFKDYMHSSANLFNIDGRTYKFREFFRDNGEVNTEVLESFLDGLNIDTKASDEPLVDNTESAAE